MDVAAALVIGFAAGMLAGMLGVGGGLLFVPALTLALGLGQLEAEATSLLAIVPVAVVGTARQRRYGNLRGRDAVALGILATGGAALGAVIASNVPEDALRFAFAGLIVLTAAQLAHRALTGGPEPSPDVISPP